MPPVLTSLQKSIHSVILGKDSRPTWINNGVPYSSKLDTFQIRMPSEILSTTLSIKSLASDGQFLYLFTSNGLFKVGSGYGGTVKGHVYVWKPDFYPNDRGTLVFCGDNLYLKLCGKRGGEFLIVEKQNLLICGSLPLHSKDAVASVVFSDGNHLGTISPAKEDGFVVRLFNHKIIPASLHCELPLKLTRKCAEAIGTSSFEEDGIVNSINIGTDDEIATICAGKEFGLIRTTSGRLFFCGKPSSLGVKTSAVKSGKWFELTITKERKVTHVALGHDGLHAVIITEDGSVFFAGTSKRGEDADFGRIRRVPKPVKPKKMIKVDNHHIVYAACNNGTTALVTRDGEVLMFGKDTTYVDQHTGEVTLLRGIFVTQIALGKAHAVCLTSKGKVITFGINNKYQCGRDFAQSNKEGDNLHLK